MKAWATRQRPAMERAWESMEEFFDGLPYFQPWVWKFIAAAWAAGFSVGLALDLWAYFSLG